MTTYAQQAETARTIDMTPTRGHAMKTTITKTAANEVTIRAIDPHMGEAINWVFWTPTNGGYVRKGANRDADDKQVCRGLDTRGVTLVADDGDDLMAVIRREWSAYRKGNWQ